MVVCLAMSTHLSFAIETQSIRGLNAIESGSPLSPEMNAFMLTARFQGLLKDTTAQGAAVNALMEGVSCWGKSDSTWSSLSLKSAEGAVCVALQVLLECSDSFGWRAERGSEYQPSVTGLRLLTQALTASRMRVFSSACFFIDNAIFS